MDEVKLEAIVQNFISIIPFLKKEGQQPISEVAKKLFISTPNMTKLLNKLIDEGMIERIP